jgi:hypothetical protein
MKTKRTISEIDFTGDHLMRSHNEDPDWYIRAAAITTDMALTKLKLSEHYKHILSHWPVLLGIMIAFALTPVVVKLFGL